MHCLFVHKNFPAQFRFIMPYLIEKHGARCTFVSEKAVATVSKDIQRIQYKPKFQASRTTSYCGRPFETQMWRSQAIVEALASYPDLKPDLIVAHSGFFTTSFLREVYDCPIINLFEYYYHSSESDYDFRSDLFEPSLIGRIRTRAKNSTFLLDLENCDLGYCPTEWQKSRFPDEYQEKLHVAHDGVDTDFWCPASADEQANDPFDIPSGTKVISYVTRGFESMRGFDIFMKFAKRICDTRKDVVFLVAGGDRMSYGPDHRLTGGKSFKDWVLAKDDYDLDRIRFLGYVPKETVRSMYRRSDLHVYLTAPFVVSWSPLDAMASGCLVMGSDTEPVQEIITHRKDGLLVDFFDSERMVDQANEALDRPEDFDDMQRNARKNIEQKFGLANALSRLHTLMQPAMKFAH